MADYIGKSEPFLRFSQEPARLGWEDRAEKRQTLVGIQGGNKPTDPAVNAILPMIRKTSTLTDKDIRPPGDSHHIYFVQEVGAFPLRLIEGMERDALPIPFSLLGRQKPVAHSSG